MGRIQASQVVVVVKNPSANAGDVRDMVLIPGLGQFPGGEGMATDSSILVWRIPWTRELGRLHSIGSQGVGQDWSDLARMHADKIYKCFSGRMLLDAKVVHLQSFILTVYGHILHL